MSCPWAKLKWSSHIGAFLILAPSAPQSGLDCGQEDAAKVPVPRRKVPEEARPDLVGVGRIRVVQDPPPRLPQQHHPQRRSEAENLQEVCRREAEGQLHLQERSFAQSESKGVGEDKALRLLYPGSILGVAQIKS